MDFLRLARTIYGGEKIRKLSEMRYFPRWIIFLIDTFLLSVSLVVALLVLDVLGIETMPTASDIFKFLPIVFVNLVCMAVFRTYTGIIRHSTIADIGRLLLSSAGTLVVLLALNLSWLLVSGTKVYLNPLLVIYFAFSFISSFMFRVLVKEFFVFFRRVGDGDKRKHILILEIGDESVAIAQALEANPSLPYSVAGFLTDRKDTYSATLLCKPIFIKDRIEDHKTRQIDAVLVIAHMLPIAKLDEWVEYCLVRNWQVLTAPSICELKQKGLQRSIRTLQIEDLLNRKPIKMEEEPVREQHKDKNILITGGAGSIGSELVRQVAQFNPSLIVIVDQAETPLYDIELEMREKYPHLKFKFILGDISNQRRMSAIFKEYRFWIVYHAAAYKHVPMIEENPREAVLVNIMGTKIISRLACEHGVSRFVMISTDKAVNPTNVMGASKRAAELFVQSFQNREGCRTKFITTRFGNVLGSNGSVIPHFRQQIEKGGPVTVTHPEIVRYFMTIPEACQLVLQAGTMGKGGEIFVFDMGKPVKILDLAKRMIKLSGYIPEQDIRIVYTGLRPGEKLYEELLSDNTKNMPTPNKKIMVSKDPTMEFEAIDRLSRHIIRAALREDKMEVVRQLKKIVPEYKSNNSEFEVLDEKRRPEPATILNYDR